MTRKTYYGPLLDISFDKELCTHSGECVQGMPVVFDVSRRPWIDAEAVDTPEREAQVREVIARCPSGALNVEEHDELVLTHNPEECRYEARLNGELAGFARYQISDRLIIFTHTEIGSKFGGRGIGSKLVDYALEDVQKDGIYQIVPVCPFVKARLDKQSS